MRPASIAEAFESMPVNTFVLLVAEAHVWQRLAGLLCTAPRDWAELGKKLFKPQNAVPT